MTENESPKRDIDHCQHCGGEIAKDAPTCIHCGSPTPRKAPNALAEQQLIARVLWFVLFVVIVIVAVYETIVTLRT